MDKLIANEWLAKLDAIKDGKEMTDKLREMMQRDDILRIPPGIARIVLGDLGKPIDAQAACFLFQDSSALIVNPIWDDEAAGTFKGVELFTVGSATPEGVPAGVPVH